MSRGHGWVQRALLIELGEEAERRPGEGLDTATLARRLFPNGRRWSWDKPANAHTATVRPIPTKPWAACSVTTASGRSRKPGGRGRLAKR